MTDVQERMHESALATGATAAFADFAVRTDAAALPEDVIHAARRAILDTVGVAVAGVDEPASRVVADYVHDTGSGAAESVIWGSKARVSASAAALANGTAAHVLDFDDAHPHMRGHPSVAVLPAVIAMGERVGASGLDVLAAFAIGVEVACRLGQLAGTEAYDRGWHVTATHGVIGATAAAGRLAGLTVEQMRMALGLAASHATGLRQNFGTMTKSYHVGRTGEFAIQAVEMIQRGFTASPVAIEGEAGYLAAFGRGTELAEEDLATVLGNPYALVDPGVNVKVYPSCAFTHAPIDLAIDLGRDIAQEDIERVVVDLVYSAPNILIHHRPRDPLSAKFSLEYCVAAGLLDHEVTLAHFTEPVVLRDDLQAMLRRVEYVVPDEWRDESYQFQTGRSRLAVHLRDGTVRRDETFAARGSAEKPLTDQELVDKFLACAGITLGRDQAEQVLEAVLNLSHGSSVTELTRRLILA